MNTDGVEDLRHQCDEALAALLDALDPVYDACSTLTEVEDAVFELAGGDTHDPGYDLLAEETRVADLRLALDVLQARLVTRHGSSVPPGLADIEPNGLRIALDA